MAATDTLLVGLIVAGLFCFASALEYKEQLLDGDLPNSYFVATHDLNKDGYPEVLSVSLDGLVYLYINDGEWQIHQALRLLLSSLEGSIAVDFGDVDEDGWDDILLAHNFGECPDHCVDSDGALSWLRNPLGQEGCGFQCEWKAFSIGEPLPGLHRIRAARLRGNETVDVVGVPVVGSGANATSNYLNSPAHITLYKNEQQHAQWPRHVVDDREHVVHDMKFADLDGDNVDEGYTASFEGLKRYEWTGGIEKDPTIHLLNEATRRPLPEFSGASSLAFASEGNSFDIATIEPFHGNTVSVYQRPSTNEPGGDWARTVLDVRASGGHDIQVSDMDGDGLDDVIAGFRGPDDKGVFIYHSTKGGGFKLVKASGVGVSTLAVADFNGDGILDLVTCGWGAIGDTRLTLLWGVNTSGDNSSWAPPKLHGTTQAQF